MSTWLIIVLCARTADGERVRHPSTSPACGAVASEVVGATVPEGALQAQDFHVPQESKPTVGITAQAHAIAAIVPENPIPVVATPSIPPAVVAAQSTSAEARKAGGIVAFWAMAITKPWAAFYSKTEEFAHKQFMKAKVSVHAPEGIIAASMVPAYPSFERA